MNQLVDTKRPSQQPTTQSRSPSPSVPPFLAAHPSRIRSHATRCGAGTILTLLASCILVLGCDDPAPPRTVSGTAGAKTKASIAAPRANENDKLGAVALAYQPDAAEASIGAGQKAARERRQSPDAWVALASAYLRRQRETSLAVYGVYAEDAIEAARTLEPTHRHGRALTVMLRLGQHRFREALELSERLASERPDDSTARLLMGDAALELGDYDKAATAYQAAMDLRPDLRVYNRGAHLRFLHGDIAGARELLEMAIEAGSARDLEAVAFSFVDLSELERKTGNIDRAIQAAVRARELVADYAPALLAEAKARILLGEQAEAVALLERARPRAGTVELLTLLATLYEAKGDRAGVKATLAEAHRKAMGEPAKMALYLARTGREPKKALELAGQAHRERATIESEIALALALARNGSRATSMAALERALRLGTNDAELLLDAALAEALNGRAAKARALLERAGALSPRENAGPWRARVESEVRALTKEST